MKSVGYYNGEIGAAEEMSVPMLDRGVYFGDGVYDAIFSSGHRYFAVEPHLDRFYRNCSRLEIPFDMDRETLKREIARTEACFDGGDALIYLQCTRGTAPRTHEFPAGEGKPNLLMMIKPIKTPARDAAIKLITVEDTRFLHCDIKTLNLLPNVFAAQRAKEAHCAEAVFHRGERVTECAHSSLMILKDGELIAPPLDELILPSITRAIIFGLCAENGIKASARLITLEELLAADEVIVCSTTKHLVRADEIDGRAVGGGDAALYQRIAALYFEKLERELTEI